MHIPKLPILQAEFMAIRRHHHMLPDTKDAHAPHFLIDDVSAVSVPGLVMIRGDARFARVVRLALTYKLLEPTLAATKRR